MGIGNISQINEVPKCSLNKFTCANAIGSAPTLCPYYATELTMALFLPPALQANDEIVSWI